MKAIPKPVLDALGKGPWTIDRLDDFERLRLSNLDDDRRDGFTAIYGFSKGGYESLGISFEEIKELELIGGIPSCMYSTSEGGFSVNQHFIHSLEQFMRNAQAQWQAHLERIEKLEPCQRKIPREYGK
jgi:hypothetical protein